MQGLKPVRRKRRRLTDASDEVVARAKQRYAAMGPRVGTRRIKDKKLKREMQVVESKIQDAAIRAAESDILNTEVAGSLEAEGLERTYKFKQRDLLPKLDRNTRAKVFNLELRDKAPYAVDFSRSGRFLLLGGKRGHVALVDLLRTDLVFELHVDEEVRDVQCLHNETLCAVAQQKYVYIYDQTGLEIHCLRKHIDPLALEFLPYHFLLASVGRAGFLKYQDVSTGQLVAEWRTKLGPCDVMAQNPSTAVMHLGHGNGTVTLWSPTVSTPLVRMLVHRGPVRAAAVSEDGNYMATSGVDGFIKIWDVRTFTQVHAYRVRTPPKSLCISQTGLLGVGFNSGVQIWKDAIATKAVSPYMNHDLEGVVIQRTKFRPYEDILGIGHAAGYSSIVVPGSGEPNFDTFTANPFQTSQQRREQEVKSLLEKLQPETIVLDQESIGAVTVDAKEVLEQRKHEADVANQRPTKEKKKARGRSKIGAKLKRKRKNVIDEEKVKLQEKLLEERSQRSGGNHHKDEGPAALRRFKKDK